MRTTLSSKLLSLAICACFFSSQVLAQTPSAPRRYQLLEDSQSDLKASEFVVRRYPGEKLIPIRVLGGVRQPGTYHVPEGTDLISLISLTGGFNANADASSIQINQWGSQKILQLDVEDVLKNPATQNPTLASSDVVYIPEQSPAVSSNTLLVVGLISSLVGIFVGGLLISNELKK